MAESKELVPVLNYELLQQKANEHAMNGAIATIKEYYEGWNSPFRKMVAEQLEAKKISGTLDLPDIIGILNDSLSREIDAIANAAIAQTFVPMAKRFLTRADKEIKFSEILKEFIKVNDIESEDDCDCFVNKHERFDWLEVELHHDKKNYKLTLHQEYESKKNKIEKYHILSLPYGDSNYKQTMKINIENASIELPFTRDILQDRFISYIGTLILSDSLITMDVKDFYEELFPERCHCD